MSVDLVLPNGKIVKQVGRVIRDYANNDYSANSNNHPTKNKWWEKEPKTAYTMMSASPNMLHVNSEKW